MYFGSRPRIRHSFAEPLPAARLRTARKVRSRHAERWPIRRQRAHLQKAARGPCLPAMDCLSDVKKRSRTTRTSVIALDAADHATGERASAPALATHSSGDLAMQHSASTCAGCAASSSSNIAAVSRPRRCAPRSVTTGAPAASVWPESFKRIKEDWGAFEPGALARGALARSARGSTRRRAHAPAAR